MVTLQAAGHQGLLAAQGEGWERPGTDVSQKEPTLWSS